VATADGPAETKTRYAVYFAPAASSPLWRFGCAAIGYDAETGEDVAQHVPAGLEPQDWAALTADPRRYGFHATLKAPFRLASAASEAALIERVGALAAGLAPVPLGGLAVQRMSSFVALLAIKPSAALSELAARLVADLDDLRAPLSDGERARRLQAKLTPRQLTQLDRFGYPYVFDDFRFHMTLAGPLPLATADRVEPALASSFAAASLDLQSFAIDHVAVFRQAAPDARFRIIGRLPLSGQR
jgi:putative phosphonate metabolism protein